MEFHEEEKAEIEECLLFLYRGMFPDDSEDKLESYRLLLERFEGAHAIGEGRLRGIKIILDRGEAEELVNVLSSYMAVVSCEAAYNESALCSLNILENVVALLEEAKA